MGDIGKTIIHGASYYAISRVSVVIFGVLSSILLARLMGASARGLWELTTSAFSIIILFSNVHGTDTAITRYVPKYNGENNPRMIRTIFFTSLKLRFLFIGSFCGVALLISEFVANKVFNNSELAVLLPVLAIGYFFSSLDFVSMFTALKKFHYRALASTLGSMLHFVFPILFLLLGWGVLGVAVGQVVSSIIVSSLVFLLALRLLPPSESCGETESGNFVSTSKMILSYGLPPSALGLLYSFSLYLRTLLLGLSVESLEVLGYFSVAWGFYQLLASSTVLVTGPLFPVIAELETKRDWATIEKSFSVLLKYMLLIAGVAIVFLEFFAPEMISLLYSESFGPAAVFLRMIVVITVPTFFVQLSATLFMAIGHSGTIAKLDAIFFLWDVPTMAFLILSFGVSGAIMFHLITSFSIRWVMHVYFLRKSLRMIPIKAKSLIRIPFVLGVVFLFLFLVRQFIIPNAYHLILLMLSVLFLSLISACVIGVVRKEEMELFKISFPTYLQKKSDFVFSFLEKIARE